MAKNGAQPAFPINGIETDLEGDGSGQKFPHVYSYEKDAGLTKRELFAAMALQGILVNLDAQAPGWLDAPARAVGMADALLAALSQPHE